MIKPEVKNILRKYHLTPFKRLGQHFLIDKKVLSKIIKAAKLLPSDIVLEVGPGLGILTWALAQKAKMVVACEKDKRFTLYLKEKFKNNPKVKIIHQDILKLLTFGFKNISLKADIVKINKIVANLPYYITSRFLRMIFEAKHKSQVCLKIAPRLIVFLVQKEVAERICAQPGQHSLLSLSCQFYGKPKIVGYVSKKSFYPPPKVDSVILKIKVFRQPFFKVNERLFFKVLKAGFSSRRKKLSNSLAQGLKISKERTRVLLKTSKIDPGKRAQELKLDDWVKIVKNLENNLF